MERKRLVAVLVGGRKLVLVGCRSGLLGGLRCGLVFLRVCALREILLSAYRGDDDRDGDRGDRDDASSYICTFSSSSSSCLCLYLCPD